MISMQLRLRAADGTLLAILPGNAEGGVLALSYRRVVNAPGLLTLTLSADSPAAPLLADRGIVEVWRRDSAHGIAWYRDFTGLILRRVWQYQDGHRVTVYCPGLMWLLATRHVLWYAGTSNRSEFTNARAETIAKTLVAYNAGPSATTANGRLRDGVISGLSIEADGAGGNSLDWYCAWANLLETLQELAHVAGGDFDLVQTGDATFEFRWYAGQLGADRTGTVIFALEHGNMADPVYDDDRRELRDVVVALGQGEGASRAIAIRTTGAAAGELTADARNETTTAGLEAIADARLAEYGAIQRFEFAALQTPSCLYGKHYFLGDLVTARYGSVIQATRKIVAVTVNWDDAGRESIIPEFGAP